MEFNDRFKKKFREQYPDIFSEDYEVSSIAWSSIIDSEEFDMTDLGDVFDVMMKRETLGFLELDLINLILNHEKVNELFFEFKDDDVLKFKDFFLSKIDLYSLNDMPEFIVSHYGKKLNWENILRNTFYFESDGLTINNNAYTLIKKYHDLMLSTEIENDEYKPASKSLFFKCLEVGAEIPYDFMKDSIFNENTTFATELDNMITYVISLEDPEQYSGFIGIKMEDSTEDISLCIELLMRRVYNDEDMRYFYGLEKVEDDFIDTSDDNDENSINDFEIDDDLGF